MQTTVCFRKPLARGQAQPCATRGSGNGRSITPGAVPAPRGASQIRGVRVPPRWVRSAAKQEIKVTSEDPEEPEDDKPTKAPAAAAPATKEEDLEAAFKMRLRATAKAELQKFNPSSISMGDKKYWLVTTVPEVPVAGEQCVIFFNRQQSEPLRERPRIVMHYGFNRWELTPEENAWVDFSPAGLPFYEGGDWWSTTVTIPEDTFEINFTFSDAEGAWENNDGNDFMFQVAGGVTVEQWEEMAEERARLAEEARKQAEELARIQAEKAELERKEAEDLQNAQNAVNEIGWRRDEMRAGGTNELKHGTQRVWYTEPEVIIAGSTATIRYNSKAGPLNWVNWAEAGAPTLKIGHNFWQRAQDIQMTKVVAKPAAPSPAFQTVATSAAPAPPTPAAAEEECWWEAKVEVDESAVALNFVVCVNDMYDNNNGGDYKALVELPKTVKSVEEWQAGLVQKLREQIKADRLAAEKAHQEKMALRAAQRAVVLEKSQEVMRKQLRFVLYTEPATPVAGEELTLFYNPNNTCLAGREKIYLTGGWNRWAHKSTVGPIEMTPPKEGDHFQATVKVPSDAWSMDFVFGDVQQGDGTYDNRNGLDYHMPTTGSTTKETPMHICHISVEMAPIAKVGGLGDVVTSLGRAMQDQGHYTEVVLPKYDFFNHSPLLGEMEYDSEFDWGGTKIFVSKCKVEGIQCFFIEPKNGMFDVGSVYGRNDDAVRFDFFCKAALEFLLQTGRQPDIIHTHDWPTAMAAQFYWTDYHHNGLWKPKVIFTIHNMNYGQARISAAAHHSQRFTTVSPSYAFEIGGHQAIGAENMKLRGIRNGIDPDIWDPETDMFLPLHYTSANVVEGKRAAKEQLRQRLNLTSWESENKPMIGVVSRLTAQKGVHLIKHSAFRTLDRGGQFVLLGSAPDPKVQADFEDTANSMRGENAAFYFAFDEPLSHLIYAACDMILVPSMFEPCGLTQMIAMRYGAVPVVRATGGLRDTVFDVDTDKARAAWEMEGSCDWEADKIDATNGFSFEGTDEGALDYALNRAIDGWYNDRDWFHSLQARCMEQDWSWNRPAQEYIELYYQARK